MGRAKEDGLIDLTWTQIADIVNQHYHEDEPRMECAYRKPFTNAKIYYDNVFKNINKDDNQQREQLAKERYKLRDERKALNRILRENARNEENFQLLLSEARKQSQHYPSPLSPAHKDNSDNDLLILLSDLHIGLEYCTWNGNYNTDIARLRLSQYLSEIIKLQKLHHSQKCYVALLGDAISGNIHRTIAIENRESVIEQIMIASALISDFLYELSKYFEFVTFVSVSGNHSRIAPKDEAIHDERLDDIIPWFTRERLINVKNVCVPETRLDTSLDSIIIREHLFLLVHGDYDSPTEASVARLVTMLKLCPYAICMGHKHVPMMSEISGIKVVQCGSLCGSGDNFTMEKRLTGKSSQTVLVCSDKGIVGYYPIELE